MIDKTCSEKRKYQSRRHEEEKPNQGQGLSALVVDTFMTCNVWALVCPAQGKRCNYCGATGHFEKVCFKKSLPTARFLNRGKRLGAIISTVGTQTQKVSVEVKIDTGCDRSMQVVIDTGSYRTAISPCDLTRFGLTEQDLDPPTEKMKYTTTATGGKMTSCGFLNAQLRCGNKQTSSKIVVLRG